MGGNAKSLEITECAFVDKILYEFLQLKKLYSNKEIVLDASTNTDTLNMILTEYRKAFQQVLDVLPEFPLSPSHKQSAEISHILAEAFCYYQKLNLRYQSCCDTTTCTQDFIYDDHSLFLERIKSSLSKKWLESLKKEQLDQSVLSPASFQYSSVSVENDSSSYLSQIKSRMIDELERMQYAAEQLEQSSLQLEHFHTLIVSFGNHFRTAFHSLQEFKLKCCG